MSTSHQAETNPISECCEVTAEVAILAICYNLRDLQTNNIFDGNYCTKIIDGNELTGRSVRSVN